jgi:hypothetical protein
MFVAAAVLGIMAYQSAMMDPNNMAYLEFGSCSPSLEMTQVLLSTLRPLAPSINAHMQQCVYWQQRAAGEPVGATPEEREAHTQMQAVYRARARECIRKAHDQLEQVIKAMVIAYAVECTARDASWHMSPQLSDWLNGPPGLYDAQHLMQLLQAGDLLP